MNLLESYTKGVYENFMTTVMQMNLNTINYMNHVLVYLLIIWSFETIRGLCIDSYEWDNCCPWYDYRALLQAYCSPRIGWLWNQIIYLYIDTLWSIWKVYLEWRLDLDNQIYIILLTNLLTSIAIISCAEMRAGLNESKIVLIFESKK